MNFLIPG